MPFDALIAASGKCIEGLPEMDFVLARCKKNYEALMRGMQERGLQPFLNPQVQAPIIVTIHAPDTGNYEFKRFYNRVRNRASCCIRASWRRRKPSASAASARSRPMRCGRRCMRLPTR